MNLLRPRTHQETLFLWHSRLHTRHEAIQPTLAALFANGLSLELIRLLKGQKIGWKGTDMTELIAIAEHFERSLEAEFQYTHFSCFCSNRGIYTYTYIQINNISDVIQNIYTHTHMYTYVC